MARLKQLEPLVLDALERSHRARSDDFILYYLVIRMLHPRAVRDRFCDVMKGHEALCLPSFESVSRCRRKIQAKREDLRDETAVEIRAKEQEDYRNYSHE